jgi:hypothetical protein
MIVGGGLMEAWLGLKKMDGGEFAEEELESEESVEVEKASKRVVGDPRDGVGQVEGACRQWYLQVKKKK